MRGEEREDAGDLKRPALSSEYEKDCEAWSMNLWWPLLFEDGTAGTAVEMGAGSHGAFFYTLSKC